MFANISYSITSNVTKSVMHFSTVGEVLESFNKMAKDLKGIYKHVNVNFNRCVDFAPSASLIAYNNTPFDKNVIMASLRTTCETVQHGGH